MFLYFTTSMAYRDLKVEGSNWWIKCNSAESATIYCVTKFQENVNMWTQVQELVYFSNKELGEGTRDWTQGRHTELHL